MKLSRDELLCRAEADSRESRFVDFKSFFDPKSSADWCELIKDIVAFSNSGGGIIVFGVDDNGKKAPGSIDLQDCDPADIANKIEKYTGVEFSDFEIIKIKRGRYHHFALLIGSSVTPIIFCKPGNYMLADKRQKIAFARGTIYFRRGAKCEPGSTIDLQRWHEREIKRLQRELLSGLRKVVEAPKGSKVHVVAQSRMRHSETSPITARFTNDPEAMAVRHENPDGYWKYKQGIVVKKLNDTLRLAKDINGHDILCVKYVYGIGADTHPHFMMRPHQDSSPQYSDNFIEWILNEYASDKQLFAKCRKAHRERDPESLSDAVGGKM
jgi:Schlafen, AlbA_2